MGNEQSNNKEPTQNGKLPEKHENGSMNGVSANMTFNGLEVDVNGGKTVHGEVEAPEPDFVVVESDSEPTEAQPISEIPELTIPKEEVKKSKSLFGKMFKKKDVTPPQQKETTNEDETDVSPAVEAQPELTASGEEAAAGIIIEQQEEIECPHYRAETSTQTDRQNEVDISTQTSDCEDANVNSEDPVGKEDSLETPAVIIAEEAVEEIANVEPSENQTAGIMYKVVIPEKWAEVSDHFEISHCNPTEEGPVEAEPGIATGPESNQIKSITEEMDAEENNTKDIVSSLPKVVTDCVELVFAAFSESNDYIVIDTSEPRIDEVIMEDNCEEAGDMSADVALIESTEPEPDVVSHESEEENGVSSLDEELMTLVTETISELAGKEPSPTPTNQDTPEEEHPTLTETEILITEDSANEELNTDDTVPIDDAPEIDEQDSLSTVNDDETSEKCGVCSEEENILIVEVSSNELPTSLNDSLGSTHHIITSNENEIEDEAISDVGQETVEESDLSPAVVSESDEVKFEATIDVLSQELECCGATSQEPVGDDDSSLEEEVFTSTFFVPLCVGQIVTLTLPEDPVDEVTEEMVEEAVEVLSNEFEAVPENLEEDTAAKETCTEEVTGVAISEESTEELTAEIDEESEDSDASTFDRPVSDSLEVILEAVDEELTEEEAECDLATSDKVVPEIAANEQIVEDESTMDSCNLVIILETKDDAVTEQNMCQSGNNDDASLEENSVTLDEPASTFDGPVSDSLEVILEAVVEELTEEEAECDLPTSDKVGPEIAANEQIVEDESTMDSYNLVIILETNDDAVTEQNMCQSGNSDDALLEDNSVTLDEPEGESVEAILETIVEDPIAEEAECHLVTSEKVGPQIGEEEETVENETIDSVTVTNLPVEALCDRLQSACTSVVENSLFRFDNLDMFPLGYSVTVTVHVAPKTEQ